MVRVKQREMPQVLETLAPWQRVQKAEPEDVGASLFAHSRLQQGTVHEGSREKASSSCYYLVCSRFLTSLLSRFSIIHCPIWHWHLSLSLSGPGQASASTGTGNHQLPYLPYNDLLDGRIDTLYATFVKG